MDKLMKKFADYQEVYTRGNYHFIAKPKVTIKFEGIFYRFEQWYEVIKEQDKNVIQWVKGDYEGAVDFVFWHKYDDSLKNDGFSIKVDESRTITVATNNLRGFKYAMEVIDELFEAKAHGIACPIIEIIHEPSFKMRGVIEGFYGIPWTHDDRIELLHYLGDNHMNTYMYAPKDDQYQRKLWREPYFSEKMHQFDELIQVAQEKQIDLFYMISPGNDIDYTISSEVEVLTNKLQQMIDAGIKNYGLLLDDIDYILKGNAKKRFASAASAHSYLITQVDAFLKSQLADYQLVACPTEYDNNYSSSYLEILNQELPKHIPLFWTGPSTLASQISTKEIARMASIYQRPMVIWDNIPVNDYQKDHELLFLSPYEKRSPKMSEDKYNVLGVVSNPMAQWELSKLTVHNMSLYLWDSHSYHAEYSWEETLRKYCGSEFADSFKIFASFQPNRHTREVFNLEQLLAIQEDDQDFITQELEKLQTVSQHLQTLPNSSFQKTVEPWLKRVEKDREYWKIVQTKDTKAIQKYSQELQKYPYRIGTDLVAKYVEYWHLLEE